MTFYEEEGHQSFVFNPSKGGLWDKEQSGKEKYYETQIIFKNDNNLEGLIAVIDELLSL